MQKTRVNGIRLYFDPAEQESAEKLSYACQESMAAIHNTWRLPAPGDCRVYLMTTFPRCVFYGAPPGSQLLLALTLPFWYREFKLRWQYAGGWSQRYGDRQVVGVKPPRLVTGNADAMGKVLFDEEHNADLKFLSVVCHELTHACTAGLNLPAWLNEGLAMVSVDRCLGKQTVLTSSLQLLKPDQNAEGAVNRIDLKTQTREEIIRLYARGYWLTRYLDENHPDLLKELIKGSSTPADLEIKIAAVLGISNEAFWKQVDTLLVEHYGK
jgi:hypothetical protein